MERPSGLIPTGLLPMQDDEDEPLQGLQNYKLVGWRDVRRALQLPSGN